MRNQALFFIVIVLVAAAILIAVVFAQARKRKKYEQTLRSHVLAQDLDARRIAQARRHYRNKIMAHESERDPLSELFGVEVPTFCKRDRSGNNERSHST